MRGERKGCQREKRREMGWERNIVHPCPDKTMSRLETLFIQPSKNSVKRKSRACNQEWEAIKKVIVFKMIRMVDKGYVFEQ